MQQWPKRPWRPHFCICWNEILDFPKFSFSLKCINIFCSRKFLESEVFRTSEYKNVAFKDVIGRCCVMNVKDYFIKKPEGFEDFKTIFVCESRYSVKSRSFKKIKQFWNVPDHINLLLRDVALEPKRVQSIFRERVEKHKNGMSLLHLCFNENIRIFCFFQFMAISRIRNWAKVLKTWSLFVQIRTEYIQGVSYVFGRFYEAVLGSLNDLKYYFSILVKISCKYLKKSIKYFFWHQAWPHNDLLLLKSKVKLLHHTYLWPPILWHNKAMGKGKIEAMATKFSEKFAIIMLKKYRKICRGGLTHLDTAPIIQIHMRHPVQ